MTAVPPISSAQFFPRASDFSITGPVFNAYLSPPSETVPTSRVPTTHFNGGSRANTASWVESEVYAQNMLLKKQGYPLWKPKSGNLRLPEVYKREGVQIGDIGILTEAGSFDYLFNVCYGAGHPLNEGRVPEGFEPMRDLDDDDIEVFAQEYEPGEFVTSHNNIRGVNIEGDPPVSGVPEEVGAGLSFSSTASKGALLVLPEGGKKADHMQRKKFEKYAAEHARTWYKYIIDGPMAREAHNSSLYLVTGYHKTRAWGVSSFDNAEGSVSMNFIPRRTLGGGLPKYWFRPCNYAASSSGADDVYGSQSGCVFLRGFKIAIRESWLFQTSLTVTDLSRLHADELLPKPAVGWLTMSWQWSNPLQPNSFPKHDLMMDNTDLTCPSGYKGLYHPSDVINQWLLDNNDKLNVAITHDDDWASVIHDDEQDMPQDEELICRISNSFHIQHIQSNDITYACFITPPSPAMLKRILLNHGLSEHRILVDMIKQWLLDNSKKLMYSRESLQNQIQASLGSSEFISELNDTEDFEDPSRLKAQVSQDSNNTENYRADFNDSQQFLANEHSTVFPGSFGSIGSQTTASLRSSWSTRYSNSSSSTFESQLSWGSSSETLYGSQALDSSIKASSTDNSPYYQELKADSIIEAQRQVENEQTLTTLQSRVDNWKGHHLENFGRLLLHDTFIVPRFEIDREYSIFLFEKIIICCKEALPTPPKVKMSSSFTLKSVLQKQGMQSPLQQPGDLGPTHRKATPLLLKGRIFLKNITKVVPIGNNRNLTSSSIYPLAIWYKGDESEDSLTMRCRSEDQMRQWESTINRLVREFAQRQASPRFLRLGRWQTPDPQSSIPPYLSSIQEGYESSGDHRTGIPPTLMYSTAVPSPLPLWNPRRHVSIGRSNVGSGSNESTGNSSDYSTDSSLPMTPYGSSESSLAGGSSDVHPKKRSQWQMSKNTFYAEANHAPFAQPVNVKVHFHEDIFIIQVPHTMEFDDLVKMVGRKIQLCGPRRDGGPLRVKYRDKDGDMVSLRSTEDIQMAFEEYQLDGQVPLFVV